MLSETIAKICSPWFALATAIISQTGSYGGLMKNAFYAQSGGVTAVINASACGVIETARRHRDKIGKVYAGRHGIIGALTEDMIDTSKESRAAISGLRHTPGGAFGSARYKLAGIDKNRAQYERLIDIFRAHDIGYFFYNGGNDSMDTAQKVSEIAVQMAYPITCIGIPKTVDNDLPVTDCCPGFGSAAKYIAVSTREAALDVASMARTVDQSIRARSHGRHAGWMAAAGGLGAEKAGDAPHVILFPEIVFDRARYLAKVKTSVEKYGYCVVVVSEGVRDSDGKFLAEAGTKDAFGHSQLGGVGPVVAQMTQEAFGYKFHWAVADYLQRSARHIASKVSVEQAYAVGKAAVEFALSRQERGDASHRPQIIKALSVEHRRSTAGSDRQQGKKAAAQLHYDGRIRHHGGLPQVFAAAHRRRSLPSVRPWPARLCRAQGASVPKRLRIPFVV